jgi:hypothetical protein
MVSLQVIDIGLLTDISPPQADASLITRNPGMKANYWRFN